MDEKNNTTERPAPKAPESAPVRRLDVAAIFSVERFEIVFSVSRKENLTAFVGGNGKNAGFVGLCEHLESRIGANRLFIDGRVTRVRQEKQVVAAAKEHIAFTYHFVGEHAREFPVKQNLANAEMMIEACLRGPADVQRAVDVRFAPIHQLREFGPIVDVLKGHAFNGRSRDHHTVEFLIAYFGEGAVKALEVALRRVFRDV